MNWRIRSRSLSSIKHLIDVFNEWGESGHDIVQLSALFARMVPWSKHKTPAYWLPRDVGLRYDVYIPRMTWCILSNNGVMLLLFTASSKNRTKTTRFIHKHTLWYPYDIVNVNHQCGRINTPWSTHTMMWVKPCDVPIILFFVSLRDYPFHSEVQCWDKYQHRVYWLEKKGSFAAFLLTRVHSYHKEVGLHCSGFIFH